MADDDLRRLEREAVTGDPEAGAALSRLRQRVGLGLTHRVAAARAGLYPQLEAAAEAEREFQAGWAAGVGRLGVARYKATDHYEATLTRKRIACSSAESRLGAALSEFRGGSDDPLPLLLAFLAFKGRYFRSGYTKGRVARALKRLEWDSELEALLREIVLEAFVSAGREFTEIRRLILRLRSPDFDDRIRRLCDPGLGLRYVQDRAHRVVELYF